jgi:hypothetical protein
VPSLGALGGIKCQSHNALSVTNSQLKQSLFIVWIANLRLSCVQLNARLNTVENAPTGNQCQIYNITLGSLSDPDHTALNSCNNLLTK